MNAKTGTRYRVVSGHLRADAVKAMKEAPPGPPPFRPTHVITDARGRETPVFLSSDGSAYTEIEWRRPGVTPDRACDEHGRWTICGQPMDGEVRRVGHRPLRPGETVARVPMSIRVPPEVKARIIAKAEARGVSPGDLVMELAEGL